MGFRREYIQTMQLSLDQVGKLEDFNSYFRQYGLGNLSDEALSSNLGSVATILDIIALSPLAPTPVGVAATIIGLFASLIQNEKDTVIAVLKQGQDGMFNLRKQMETNLSWEAVEVEVPILKSIDEHVKSI